MTPRIAFFLGLIIVCMAAADLYFDWGGFVFAMQRLDSAVHWTAFWR